MDLICKKAPASPGGASEILADPLVDPKPEESDDPVIICRNCQNEVTRPEYGVLVNQASTHTFANPNGQVFVIGCFSRADGCVKASLPTQEFTWFRGYAWAVGLCRNCKKQLGWIFIPRDPGTRNAFFGLILDELIFP